MMRIEALILICCLAPIQALFDCNTLECNACAGSYRQVDYLFLLDATGSMRDEIAALGSGVAKFTQSAANKSINARYSIVLFGQAPENILDFTYDANVVVTLFPKIRDSYVPGVHLAHTGPEAGFELMRMSQGQAAYNDMETELGTNHAPLVFRSTALRLILFVSDEDSDCPYYQANRFSTGGVQQLFSQEPPDTISLNTGWDTDRIAASDALIGSNVYTMMLINPLDKPVPMQYGCPAADTSDPTYGNFNPQATLQKLSTSCPQDASLSLQGSLLRAGLFVRVFFINLLSSPSFVSTFFEVALNATPVCGVTDDCFSSTCNAQDGCQHIAKCNDWDEQSNRVQQGLNPQCTNNCLIGGFCYGFAEHKPGDACLTCNPGSDDWIGCEDNDVCTEDICDSAGIGCLYDASAPSVCTAACNKCFIGGSCYNINDMFPNPDPSLGQDCFWCDPNTDDRAWSNMTFLPKCNPSIPQVSLGGTDDDGDGIPNPMDNCRYVYNPSQSNFDNDTMGDNCDPCPLNSLDFEPPRSDGSGGGACGTLSTSSSTSSYICSGHGYCGCMASASGSPACVCDANYWGEQCQNDLLCTSAVDPRFVRPGCSGHGTCVVRPGQDRAQCDCFIGYTGFDCSKTVQCSGCNNPFSVCIADGVCSCTVPNFEYDSATQQCQPFGYCPVSGCGSGACNTAATTGLACTCSVGFQTDLNMSSATYGSCIACPSSGCRSFGPAPTPTNASPTNSSTNSSAPTAMPSTSTAPSGGLCRSDADCAVGQQCILEFSLCKDAGQKPQDSAARRSSCFGD